MHTSDLDFWPGALNMMEDVPRIAVFTQLYST